MSTVSVLNQNAQAVECVRVKLGEPQSESDAGYRVDDRSLHVKCSSGQSDGEIVDCRTYRRHRETAFDITTSWAETGDAGPFFSPRALPCAVEVLIDPLSLPTISAF